MKNNIQNIWQWESNKINKLEHIYKKMVKPSERLLFLIDSFDDYSRNYTFGEYDFTIIIEKEEELLRWEYLEFLDRKFSEFKNEFGSVLSQMDT